MKFTYRMFPDWLRQVSRHIPDPRIKAKCLYSMEQVFFSGLLMFILRSRSLRAFTKENRGNETALKNLNRWITISDLPSDDELRYCLQTVPTSGLNFLLRDLHQRMERQKLLKDDRLFDRHELVVFDGSGQISSSKIHCEKCLTKVHQDGKTTFWHGQLLASLTNKSAAYALPLLFEPIERDGVDTQYSKNDCELSAGKRMILKMKTLYPKRSFCILADNLFAVDPFIRLILEKGWHFIMTAKEERNKELFLMFEYVREKQECHEVIDRDGSIRSYRWSNGLPLKYYKDGGGEILVNLVRYREISPDGEILFESAWLTDFQIDKHNVRIIAQAGRARFVIENRNFNEQKNLGFSTEHNFGHFGNLPSVFFGLALIAQLITELFRFWKNGKAAIEAIGSKRRYFERLAVVLGVKIIEDDDGPIVNLKFEFNSG